MPASRDKAGRFVKGCSGNPSGTRKHTQEERDALDAMKDLTTDAVRCLERILKDGKASAAARVRAAEIVLDRVYGKPKVSAEIRTPVDFSALEEINYGNYDDV